MYKLADFAHIPVPNRPVPVMIGGGGPRKVPRLAGTFASEFNIIQVDPSQPFESEVKLRVERAKRAAEKAGRDPDDLLISTVVTIIGVDTQAELVEVIAERARERGIDPEEAKQQIIEFNMPIGTWDQVYERLHDWQGLGFQRIYLPVWGKPWDRQWAEATFQGLSQYK